MLEVKVTITAADLAAAINNLASALSDAKQRIDNAGTINMSSGERVQPAAPTAPVNPIPAQAAQQTAAPVITPPTAEQPTPPIVPLVPVAPPVPTVPTETAAPAVNAAPTAAVPTAAPQYTLEMIATAGSALIDAGKMDQLMLLLNKFGVASLTDIDPNNYGAVANELRAMGAAI